MNWGESGVLNTKKRRAMKTNKSKLGRKGKAMYYLTIAIGIYFVVWAIMGMLIM